MRNWVLTLALALAVCVGSFGAFYALNRPPAALRAAAESGDALQWMRVEFKLTPSQFEQIKQLHEAYGAVCSRHCAAIMAAEKRGAQPAEVAALENVCVTSMTDHFQRVAAIMAPDEGKRYLAYVMPRVNDYDHRGAPDLRGRN